MSKKSAWLTWMPAGADAPQPQPAVVALDKNGFAVTGAPWIDAPADFAWTELAKHLGADDGPDLWVIGARRQDLANVEHRFGLSMVAATVRAMRKKPLLTIVLGLDGAPAADALPTLLQAAERVDGSGTWAAKVFIAASKPAKAPAEPFRLRAHAQRMLGLWLEVGPATGAWNGALVGVAGAKITMHAVGPRGGLPERTVLNYALEGLEVEIGSEAFHAWAVQNALGEGDSYYVKLDGRPTKVLIGQHPDVDAEVSVLGF